MIAGQTPAGAPGRARARTTRQSVAVVDAGFLPTTRRMALAVSDELSLYVTPIAVAPGSLAPRVPVIGRELARRAVAEPLSTRARGAGTGVEALRLALLRTGVRRFDYELIWRRNIAVDRRAATMFGDATTVIGQYGACLASFRRARATGGRTLLDYPIARDEAVQRILSEEARLRPDFADTIRGTGVVTRPEHVARIDEEISLADAIVVGSQFAAESFAGVVDPERLCVVPYGVDTTVFRPAATQREGGPLRVLFAGQVTQRKGIAYVLDAMRLLDPAGFTLTLAGSITGSGAGLRPYETDFRHLDGVRPQDMPALYGDADVVVLPSLVEGSALVVLEAMASGLPVIVTPNTGSDALRDGIDGFVAPVRSAEAIAERLATLRADPELRARMGRAARQRSLSFDWSQFTRRFREAAGFDDPVTLDQQVPA